MVNVKGPKGASELSLHDSVAVSQNDSELNFAMVDKEASNLAMAGTMRSLVANMVQGVSQGFEKKLTLIGVGYRAQVQGKVLNLTLGFSHPVDFEIPEGITIECPSQTEIIVKGIDKQLVGQVSADIRKWREPEPYKGKGIRYADEYVIRKEAKKK
jgi:large subunit ribosomal protein L6